MAHLILHPCRSHLREKKGSSRRGWASLAAITGVAGFLISFKGWNSLVISSRNCNSWRFRPLKKREKHANMPRTVKSWLVSYTCTPIPQKRLPVVQCHTGEMGGTMNPGKPNFHRKPYEMVRSLIVRVSWSLEVANGFLHFPCLSPCQQHHLSQFWGDVWEEKCEVLTRGDR